MLRNPLGSLVFFSFFSWTMAQERLWKEGEPYRVQDAQGREKVLVEYFRPVLPYTWDLSLMANSCTSLDQVRCVLRIERQQREIIIQTPSLHAGGFTMAGRPRTFMVDRFSAFFWETQGYTLPFEEGVEEDIFSCDRMDWLPPSPLSPVSVFAWTFQGEFRNPMFPGEANTLQYALVARGVRLNFLNTLSMTPTHMDSLSMPYLTSQGGVEGALAKIDRSDSTEFVFLSSDFKDHSLALGRDEHLCAVEFSLNRRPLVNSGKRAVGVPWEDTRPLFVDSRDVHQIVMPSAFRRIAP